MHSKQCEVQEINNTSVDKCVFMVQQWVQSGIDTHTAIQLHDSTDIWNCAKHLVSNAYGKMIL
jgi:hypothetical protein